MTDIFNEASTQTAPSQPQEGDALATKLASITNEKGEPKYANVDVALDALKNSQDYIPSLKNELASKDAELAEIRAQMAETQGMVKAQEELVRLMQTQQTTAQPEPMVAPQPASSQDTVDINSLVQAAFQAHQQQTVANENLNEVNKALASQYGDKAVEVLQTKAQELNTTPEAIQEMAKQNPTMALKLLGTEKPKAMSYGGTNTAAWPTPKVEPLTAPAKSMLAGAKQSEIKDFMKAVQAEIYREHGITG